MLHKELKKTVTQVTTIHLGQLFAPHADNDSFGIGALVRQFMPSKAGDEQTPISFQVPKEIQSPKASVMPRRVQTPTVPQMSSEDEGPFGFLMPSEGKSSVGFPLQTEDDSSDDQSEGPTPAGFELPAGLQFMSGRPSPEAARSSTGGQQSAPVDLSKIFGMLAQLQNGGNGVGSDQGDDE